MFIYVDFSNNYSYIIFLKISLNMSLYLQAHYYAFSIDIYILTF